MGTQNESTCAEVLCCFTVCIFGYSKKKHIEFVPSDCTVSGGFYPSSCLDQVNSIKGRYNSESLSLLFIATALVLHFWGLSKKGIEMETPMS